MDLFDKPKLDLNNITCHSGGALSDTSFELIGEKFGIKQRHIHTRQIYTQVTIKLRLVMMILQTVLKRYIKQNKILSRYGISKYINLLARNWVKYSEELFAIGYVVKTGERGSKGFYNKSKLDVLMVVLVMLTNGNNHGRLVYVFDQKK
jgi:hypothetical protein